jgi:hypothetical protein
MSKQDPGQDEGRSAVSRRRALVKLGLATGAVYMAPTVLKLNRSKAILPILTPCPQTNNNPADDPPGTTCPP